MICTNKYSLAPEILRGSVAALNLHHSNIGTRKAFPLFDNFK